MDFLDFREPVQVLPDPAGSELSGGHGRQSRLLLAEVPANAGEGVLLIGGQDHVVTARPPA